MSVYYLTLEDYLAIAAAVTGQSVQTLVTATNTAMADSALHAPLGRSDRYFALDRNNQSAATRHRHVLRSAYRCS